MIFLNDCIEIVALSSLCFFIVTMQIEIPTYQLPSTYTLTFVMAIHTIISKY